MKLKYSASETVKHSFYISLQNTKYIYIYLSIYNVSTIIYLLLWFQIHSKSNPSSLCFMFAENMKFELMSFLNNKTAQHYDYDDRVGRAYHSFWNACKV